MSSREAKHEARAPAQAVAEDEAATAAESAPAAGQEEGPAAGAAATATPSQDAANQRPAPDPAPQEEERAGDAGTGETDDADRHSPSPAPATDSPDPDELAAQRDEYLELAQRTKADFENYRKRVARDAAQAEVRGVVRLAKELLPGLDNLERALAALDAHDGQLVEGIRLVQAELIAALARVGLEAYSPRGERFDPELHEAMAQQPAGDDVESGTVIEVYQPGYRLESYVIRPARVVVAA